MVTFNVIKEIKTNVVSFEKESAHFKYERYERKKTIEMVLGQGKCLTSFVVDKAHKNGNTIDYILDNGVVVIVNEKSKKLVTTIVPRLPQLRRYFKDGFIPQQYSSLIKIAIHNERMGYHKM